LEQRGSGAACHQRLMLESLSAWLGAPNPGGQADGLYFAGSAGFRDVFRGHDLAIEPCPRGAPPGAVRLEFRPGDPLIVPPSDSMHSIRNGTALEIHNLSGPSCSSDHLTYWVSGRPPDLPTDPERQ